MSEAARIHAYVKAHPGCRRKEIVLGANVTSSNASALISVLRRNGCLTEEIDEEYVDLKTGSVKRKFKRYKAVGEYAAGKAFRHSDSSAGYPVFELCLKAMRYLHSHPDSSLREIYTGMGIEKNEAYKVISVLLKRNLISKDKDERAIRNPVSVVIRNTIIYNIKEEA